MCREEGKKRTMEGDKAVEMGHELRVDPQNTNSKKCKGHPMSRWGKEMGMKSKITMQILERKTTKRTNFNTFHLKNRKCNFAKMTV